MALMIFSKRSRKTVLCSINPFAKLSALIAISFAITSPNPIHFAISAVFILFLCLLVRLPVLTYLRKSKALLFLTFLIFITELIASHEIASSLYEGGKFLSLIILSSLLLDSTTPSEIAASLGGVSSHLAGKYAWRFSAMVMLSISFISRLFILSSNLMDARKARLGSFWRSPLKSASEYVTSLFYSVFDDISAYYDALSSRLFDENMPRLRASYRLSDYAIIALSVTVSVWTRLI